MNSLITVFLLTCKESLLYVKEHTDGPSSPPAKNIAYDIIGLLLMSAYCLKGDHISCTCLNTHLTISALFSTEPTTTKVSSARLNIHLPHVRNSTTTRQDTEKWCRVAVSDVYCRIFINKGSALDRLPHSQSTDRSGLVCVRRERR